MGRWLNIFCGSIGAVESMGGLFWVNGVVRLIVPMLIELIYISNRGRYLGLVVVD